MYEIADLLLQSLDKSWGKSSNVNEEDRCEVFLKHMENKLTYMKDEGFIADFDINPIDIDITKLNLDADEKWK